MKNPAFTLRRGSSLLTLCALLAMPQLVFAVNVTGYVSTIQQFGTGSAFYLGHTVLASTDFNRLDAGGTFIAQCNHPATLPVTGERAFTSTTFGFGKNMATVTIPAQQPATRNVTGWTQVPPETHLSCSYRWTAYATESGYSVGAGGITFQVGNGSARDGGTTDFTMYRRTRPEDAGGGCAP
jgi:hypothetical protein